MKQYALVRYFVLPDHPYSFTIIHLFIYYLYDVFVRYDSTDWVYGYCPFSALPFILLSTPCYDVVYFKQYSLVIDENKVFDSFLSYIHM